VRSHPLWVCALIQFKMSDRLNSRFLDALSAKLCLKR